MSQYSVISLSDLKAQHEPAVTLRGFKGGPKAVLASTETLRLLWTLEARGYTLEASGGPLRVTPPAGIRMTKEQTETVAKHLASLTRLVKYVEQMDADSYRAYRTY